MLQIGSSLKQFWDSLISAEIVEGDADTIVLEFAHKNTSLKVSDFSLLDKSFTYNASGGALCGINLQSAQYYNGVTYIAFAGQDDDPYILTYNNSTGVFSSPVKIGDTPLSQYDRHGQPAILVDSDGYIHCFFGCHISAIKYSKSTNPEDISAWTAKTDISNYATYPQVLQLSDDTIFLFFKKRDSAPEGWYYITSTDGGNNWSSETRVTDYKSYGKFIADENDKIHFACSNSPAEGAYDRKNIQYFYRESGGTWKNIAGTTLTLPIANTTSILVYDCGSKSTNEPDIKTYSGNPYIIFGEIGSINQNTVVYKFAKWSGSTWTIINITTTGIPNLIQREALDVLDANSMHCYITVGQYIEKWITSDAGANWAKYETMVQTYLPDPMIVLNGTRNARVLFQYYDTDYTFNFNLFLYGDSGFITDQVTISNITRNLDNNIIYLNLASAVNPISLLQVQCKNFNKVNIDNNLTYFDQNAKSYLNAAGIPNDSTIFYSGTVYEITGAEIWLAVNDYFLALYDADIYKKMQCIYLMIGGTAAYHKWNAKYPINFDLANRLTFSGGLTHSATGILPDGTSGWANTYFVPSVSMIDNFHISYYSLTNSAKAGEYCVGALNVAGTAASLFILRRDNNVATFGMATGSSSTGAANTISAVNDSRGLFTGNLLSDVAKIYKAGQIVSGTSSDYNVAVTDRSLGLFARNGATVLGFTDKECCYLTLGNGFTDADALAEYNAAQALQTALHRNI